MEALLEQIKEKIDTATTIAIFGHENIDGDSIGSMLWLWTILEKLWKKISYFTPYAPSKVYSFVQWIEKIQSDFDYWTYDLLIFADFYTYLRIGRFTRQKEEYFNKNQIVIFDHHHTQESYPHALSLRDARSTSTCEVIYETVKIRRPELLDQTIATYFFLWITTDSGNFVYDDDSKRTFRNAFELLNLWADKKLIVKNIVRNKSLNAIKFTQIVLSRLVEDDWILYSFYESWELSKYNVDEEEADYAMNIIQNVSWPKLFLLIRNKDRRFKVSLRSRWDVDCSWIASQFGWWWHKNASWLSQALDENIWFQGQIQKLLQDIKSLLR